MTASSATGAKAGNVLGTGQTGAKQTARPPVTKRKADKRRKPAGAGTPTQMNSRRLLLQVPLLGVQLVLLYAAINALLPVHLLLGLHLLLVVGMTLLCRVLRQHPLFFELCMATLWLAIAGPFGAAVSFTLALYRQTVLAGKTPQPYLSTDSDAAADDHADADDWASFEGENAVDPLDRSRSELVDSLVGRIKSDRVNLSPTDSLHSLRDCLSHGDQSRKMNALRVVEANYEPRFGEVLNAGVVDTDPAVRVMAATILAKLKKRGTDSIASRTQTYEQTQTQTDALKLSEAHLDFAVSGLLTPDLSVEHHQLAQRYMQASRS